MFPTLWEFLQSLGVSPSSTWVLGVSIAALTITDMLAGLVVGRIVDVLKAKTKLLIAVLNVFLVAASLLYLSASSAWIVVLSRLMGGVGNVASVALMAEVARSTSEEERSRVLIGFNVAQQVGLLFGPAANLFLRNAHFSILGLIEVNKLNAPGFFMAVLYLVLEILIFAFYYDLHNGGDTVEEDESDNAVQAVSWNDYLNEMLRPEIVAIIFVRFVALFGQTCMETIATPFMMTYYDYGDFENSLLYLFGGLVLIPMSLIMALASKRVSDRIFVAFGALVHIVTLVWFIAMSANFGPHDRSGLPYFAVGVVLDLTSDIMILDFALSLLTKLVRDEIQGFATAIRRFMSNLAMLLGPIWGGASFPWLPWLFGLPMVIMMIATSLFAHSYSKMVPISQRRHVDSTQSSEDDESNPLLRNDPAEEARTPHQSYNTC